MKADARLRMEVYQEGQRAYGADTPCPYIDWRAKTWEKGRKAAQEWHADTASEDRKAPPHEITRPYGSCTITGPAEDVAFILRHLPDVDDA